ncbi:DUF1090 family protein [Enterobacter cancerogenus]
MKFSPSVLTGLLMLAPVLSAVAAIEVATVCEALRQDTEQQLRYARNNGNDHRITGLQKVLSKVSSHCTDGSRTRSGRA